MICQRFFDKNSDFGVTPIVKLASANPICAILTKKHTSLLDGKTVIGYNYVKGGEDMSKGFIKTVTFILLAAVIFAVFSVVAAADEGITVSEPTGGTEITEDATNDVIIEQHAMKKYEWAYYVIALASVAAVVAAAVIIAKKKK